ncbi:DUF805 domain-containing protein [Microbacterium sp. ANT_H45B]|uniref:DUF805 domain-containing protein n=1 Tax=Microbacterium sp. ANT_H45B TaxID=2597346 RepID=UPI0011EF0904|nr:DUF805 domain-containing protein [Microbacterium sp. ANT_H45B]KAA0960699.1 DUF805 domain-containing protein [Microbacterium sp. ANT_H45B]
MTTTQIALGEPLYGASFPQAVSRFFLKYATFSGRASRSEYWWWVLANVLVALAFNLIGSQTDPQWTSRPIDVFSPFASGGAFALASPVGVVFLIYATGILIPALALTWRRLHDIDRSGAWFFIVLVPLIGAIVLLVFTLLSARPAGSRFDE